MDKSPELIGVVGRSDTGKTSLVERLIKKLSQKGYKIASIKHTREDFEIDTEGSDTWKHKDAGSQTIVFSTPKQTSFMVQGRFNLNEIKNTLNSIEEYDLIIIEGMKESDIFKISTDETLSGDMLFHNNFKDILETVEKRIKINKILQDLPGMNCKKCGYDSCQNFAESVYRSESDIVECEHYMEKSLEIIVNGDEIFVADFPGIMIKNVINGLMKSLKGVENIEDVEIRYSNSKSE